MEESSPSYIALLATKEVKRDTPKKVARDIRTARVEVARARRIVYYLKIVEERTSRENQ